jgi:hypothetical protein
MRRGREELESNALAFIRGVSEKHDAAFLLFLREWVGDDQNRIHIQRLIQIHQAAVRIDHHGFAGFPKTAAVGIFSSDNHTHTHKNPRAAPKFTYVCLQHVVSMLLHKDLSVNECVRGVFPACNLQAKYLSPTEACSHFLSEALRAMILHVI